MLIGPYKTGYERYFFTLWAPKARAVKLELLKHPDNTPPKDPYDFTVREALPMASRDHGYFTVEAQGLKNGDLYRFNLDGKTIRADPASHYQPYDVHGPSALVDHEAFTWQCQHFAPKPLNQSVIYELHIGTFTPQGTFDAAIERLDDLARLGVTTLEIMPVSQFPGSRNWGYDGVYPYATQHSYGGPEGFKRLISACHERGLSVILDVVYNHLGPEGNYLRDFAPYFTNAYKTPWGEALNFDGPHSDGVREFFIQNALFWLREYHIDGLRLDATHAIFDERPVHLLAELTAAVRKFEKNEGRSTVLIAESDRNDPKLVLARGLGGYGLDAVWSDDFHHAVHALLTGERHGYYQDYGEMEDIARAVRFGFGYQGEYSPFRKHRYGADASLVPGEAHIFCIQNHDQTGNRMLGDRFSALLPLEAQKAAAALLLFAPGTPMLFMGEEYSETAPFLYFISHHDQGLVDAVRKGRKREFKHFSWKGEAPDPQDATTMRKSTLNWEQRKMPGHKELLDFYTTCLRLRRELPALSSGLKPATLAWPGNKSKTLALRRSMDGVHALGLFNLDNASGHDMNLDLYNGGGTWQKQLDSSDATFGGPGTQLPETAQGVVTLPPLSAVLYTLEERM